MVDAQVPFFWIMLGLYLTSSCLSFSGLVLGRTSLVSWAVGAGVLGFAAHSAILVLRWPGTDRNPGATDYDIALAGVWVMMFGTLIVLSRLRSG